MTDITINNKYLGETVSLTIAIVDVATEPTISIGTASANPEYDSGDTYVPNMLFGFNSSNF
jgi:hypothetical protein